MFSFISVSRYSRNSRLAGGEVLYWGWRKRGILIVICARVGVTQTLWNQERGLRKTES